MEPIAPQEDIEEPTPIEEPPAPIVEEAPAPIVEESIEQLEEPQTPTPKKRGRPKKDPTVKAAAPKQAVRMKQPPTPESSDDEPLDRDDMETLLLDYLIKRKQTQQDARRNMWAQLAGLR